MRTQNMNAPSAASSGASQRSGQRRAFWSAGGVGAIGPRGGRRALRVSLFGDAELIRVAPHRAAWTQGRWRSCCARRRSRTGRDEAGGALPESVADHSWRVALLAALLAPEGVDRARAVELSVLHDACEAATGDLVPGEYASREEKLARERAGLLAMLEGAPDAARSRVLGAFDEMARDETPEARFVHEIDKLEMALQARRYQERGVPAAALESYRATARRGVASPALREALDALTSGP